MGLGFDGTVGVGVDVDVDAVRHNMTCLGAWTRSCRECECRCTCV